LVAIRTQIRDVNYYNIVALVEQLKKVKEENLELHLIIATLSAELQVAQQNSEIRDSLSFIAIFHVLESRTKLQHHIPNNSTWSKHLIKLHT
jgi:uncharacterized membrane protein YcfT